MDCSLPGSSVHGILQARILEWIAISFSRGSCRPGIETWSPILQADSLLPGQPGSLFNCQIKISISESLVRSLGWDNPLEKETATHSSIPAWSILWTEEPGGLQSIGLQRVEHDWSYLTYTPSQSRTTHLLIITEVLIHIFFRLSVLLSGNKETSFHW